ncbi:annexin B9-like isoform X2 [Anthonomus grandis grandis]|uniref:annexin B9-like isoform X2 n=1 Tax=Anthonomus grandis grandis TaxID=2921223 RepID=UPI0021654D10|nr:annexin B9-like isoform X2 [Anthonomus grandis grandis]
MAKTPTVRPAADFDEEADAKALKEAFKGFGTDEETVIAIIGNRSNDQRRKIAAAFKTMYGKDLIKELKSELRGNFEDIMVALMTEPLEYQAKELHHAISGLGTNESTLVEILGIHNNEEITTIVNLYEGLYLTSLESDIKGDTTGHLKRLLVSLANGHRDESDEVDEESARQDAQALLQAGELLFAGTDESVFNMVLCQRNRPQLRRIFHEYEQITGHSIEKAIENEFSGDIKDSLLQLVHAVRDPIDFLATRLHDSMEGIGTDDRTLIRIVVGRSEIDLGEIKEVFEAKYGKTLAESIEDTSGDYKRTLLAIVA